MDFPNGFPNGFSKRYLKLDGSIHVETPHSWMVNFIGKSQSEIWRIWGYPDFRKPSNGTEKMQKVIPLRKSITDDKCHNDSYLGALV